MKMFVEPADIYLYVDEVDFRKSINGMVVEQQLVLSIFMYLLEQLILPDYEID